MCCERYFYDFCALLRLILQSPPVGLLSVPRQFGLVLKDGYHYLRARFSVRKRVMMLQRNAQVVAYMGELRRGDLKNAAGQLYGTLKRLLRGPQPGLGAADVQNAFVEARVMGGKELGAFKERFDLGPKLSEGGCVLHVLPGQTVYLGENKSAARRPDKIMPAAHDLMTFHACEPYRTGGIPAVIGRLKING